MKTIIILLLLTSSLYSQKVDYRLSKSEKCIITGAGLTLATYGMLLPYKSEKDLRDKEIICLSGVLFASIPYIKISKNNLSMELRTNKLYFKYSFKHKKKYNCENMKVKIKHLK